MCFYMMHVTLFNRPKLDIINTEDGKRNGER